MSQDSEQPTISTKDLEKIMTKAYDKTFAEEFEEYKKNKKHVPGFSVHAFQANVVEALEKKLPEGGIRPQAMGDAIKEIGKKLWALKNEENSEVKATNIIAKGASKISKMYKVFRLNKEIKNLKGVMQKAEIIKPKQTWKDWAKEKISRKGKGGISQ